MDNHSLYKYHFGYTFVVLTRLISSPSSLVFSEEKWDFLFFFNNLFNLFLFLFYDIFCYLLQKTKQFTLQIENCVQIMEQLNIPMNLSRCFWQQCYMMLFFVFMIIYVTIFDIRTFISLELNYWRIFIFFYLYYYPFILLSIFDFNFVFWVR